jgi:hypothetical protein
MIIPEVQQAPAFLFQKPTTENPCFIVGHAPLVQQQADGIGPVFTIVIGTRPAKNGAGLKKPEQFFRGLP